MTDRLLVLGATGQVGRAIEALVGNTADYWSSRDLDLADVDAIHLRIAAARPSAIINCAAYNLVDQAETEPETAFAINAVAVGELAAAAKAIGARFVTFSSDYVFDGGQSEPYTESSEPNPLSSYGHSKLEGELMAAAANDDSLIIRTSWVMSGRPGQFAATVLGVARAGGGRFVDDQIGTPTMASDLAAATLAVLDAGMVGLLHCVNGPAISRFLLARQIVDLAGMDPELIQPCTSEELGAAAVRPHNSALATERGVDPLGDYLPKLGTAVAELLAPAAGKVED